jgi:hypothetical protein
MTYALPDAINTALSEDRPEPVLAYLATLPEGDAAEFDVGLWGEGPWPMAMHAAVALILGGPNDSPQTRVVDALMARNPVLSPRFAAMVTMARDAHHNNGNLPNAPGAEGLAPFDGARLNQVLEGLAAFQELDHPSRPQSLKVGVQATSRVRRLIEATVYAGGYDPDTGMLAAADVLRPFLRRGVLTWHDLNPSDPGKAWTFFGAAWSTLSIDERLDRWLDVPPSQISRNPKERLLYPDWRKSLLGLARSLQTSGHPLPLDTRVEAHFPEWIAQAQAQAVLQAGDKAPAVGPRRRGPSRS